MCEYALRAGSHELYAPLEEPERVAELFHAFLGVLTTWEEVQAWSSIRVVPKGNLLSRHGL